ncbi:hypothetical protein B4W72_11820 [Staphylococcus delphini]|uniref:hypothetical protein n=1 Tax=Staphylococcus delphini TaxID=53344 RepID=UPI000BBBE7EC|nr:hypothetical protein [Staphylococcus delphini]PCF70788.1 hypothetical protein B4W72_11820 [Staphylococcus delphini]
MTNQIETLITLNKEYLRLLEAHRFDKYAYVKSNVTKTRLKRMGLVVRQSILEFEKGGMEND